MLLSDGQAAHIGDGVKRLVCRDADDYTSRALNGVAGDYEVYPGHMDSTTLERERMFNYYCRSAMQG